MPLLGSALWRFRGRLEFEQAVQCSFIFYRLFAGKVYLSNKGACCFKRPRDLRLLKMVFDLSSIPRDEANLNLPTRRGHNIKNMLLH